MKHKQLATLRTAPKNETARLDGIWNVMWHYVLISETEGALIRFDMLLV
jgi:hypothetical protein